jgi:hypothetical protein
VDGLLASTFKVEYDADEHRGRVLDAFREAALISRRANRVLGANNVPSRARSVPHCRTSQPRLQSESLRTGGRVQDRHRTRDLQDKTAATVP